MHVYMQGGPKITQFLYAYNFIKYQPIFTIILLSESGENM